MSLVAALSGLLIVAVGALGVVSPQRLLALETRFFGVQRFQAVLGWWLLRSAGLMRSWCLVVVLLGATVVWAVAR